MNNQVEKYTSESEKRFKQRLEFIKKCNNTYQLKDAIRLSKFWYNIKFNKTKYDKEIYEIVKKIDNLV